MASIAAPLFTASINAAVSSNSGRHNYVGFFIGSSVVFNNGGTAHRLFSSVSRFHPLPQFLTSRYLHTASLLQFPLASGNSSGRQNTHVGFCIGSSVVFNNGGTTHRLFSSMSNHRREGVRDSTSKTHCSLLEIENNERDDEACELVSGSELSLGEGPDQIRASLFKAVKNNNGTGILLLSDIFGFEDSFTRDFAYRVACNGFNVLVPDLFRGDPWTKNKPKSIFEQWITSHDPEKTLTDIATSEKWMVDEFMAEGSSKKLGIIGFCYGGGRLIEVLARDKGAHFGSGVSFYGTRMDRSVASDVKVPVLFILGDRDPLCPIDDVENLQKSIGNQSKMVVFEGRGHGFAHRPQSQEEDTDADEAFLVMRDWLRDELM